MKNEVQFSKEVLLNTVSESDRNQYQRPAALCWKALKAGQEVKVLVEFTETGWCLIYLNIEGIEYQLTKKKLRSSDLQYHIGKVS